MHINRQVGMKNYNKLFGLLGVFASFMLLSGCEYDVLNPAGYIAQEQRTLIYICVGVMLCVVIPVMIAVVVFAIKYRATNTEAEFLPDWGHSTKIEIYMWGIPVIIVVCLAVLTGIATHKLEPSKPIDQAIVGTQVPIQIDAVALDWKWLFIYPQYGVASINEIYAPEGRQVLIQMSSESSVNAFWVPRLGTVLYAMPQMNAKLHLVASEQGVYSGSSANFSGDGFSNMRFKWHSVSQASFENWIVQARQKGSVLDRAEYTKLSISPKMNDAVAKEKDEQVRYFSKVDNDLYYRVVNRCVGEKAVCNQDQMKKAAAETLWGELCSVFDSDVI